MLFFWRRTVGMAPQLWRSFAQEQHGWSQGKESSSCAAFNGETVPQILVEDEDRHRGLRLHLLTGCMATFQEGDVRRQSLSDKSTTWRLERLGLKSLTAFHDLTNAFGSVKWEAMDRAAAALLGPNHPPGTAEIQIGDHDYSRQ